MKPRLSSASASQPTLIKMTQPISLIQSSQPSSFVSPSLPAMAQPDEYISKKIPLTQRSRQDKVVNFILEESTSNLTNDMPPLSSPWRARTSALPESLISNDISLVEIQLSDSNPRPSVPQQTVVIDLTLDDSNSESEPRNKDDRLPSQPASGAVLDIRESSPNTLASKPSLVLDHYQELDAGVFSNEQETLSNVSCEDDLELVERSILNSKSTLRIQGNLVQSGKPSPSLFVPETTLLTSISSTTPSPTTEDNPKSREEFPSLFVPQDTQQGVPSQGYQPARSEAAVPTVEPEEEIISLPQKKTLKRPSRDLLGRYRGETPDPDASVAVRSNPRYPVPVKPLRAKRSICKAKQNRQSTKTIYQRKDIYDDFDYPVKRRRFDGNYQQICDSEGRKLLIIPMMGAEFGTSLSTKDVLALEKQENLFSETFNNAFETVLKDNQVPQINQRLKDDEEEKINGGLNGIIRKPKPQFQIPTSMLHDPLTKSAGTVRSGATKENNMRAPTFLFPHQEIVQIEVEEHVFGVYFAFIEYYSPILAEACRFAININKGASLEILSGLSHKVFGLFVSWIYHPAASSLINRHGQPAQQDRLIRVWILAEKLSIPHLQNDAIDSLDRRRKWEGKIHYHQFKFVYSNTGIDSMLRSYLVDICAFQAEPATADELLKSFLREMRDEIELAKLTKRENADDEVEQGMERYHVPEH